MFDIIQLNEKLLPELKDIARKLSIENFESLKKQDLVYRILDHQALNPEINFGALGIEIPEKTESVKKPRATSKAKEKAATPAPAPAADSPRDGSAGPRRDGGSTT